MLERGLQVWTAVVIQLQLEIIETGISLPRPDRLNAST